MIEIGIILSNHCCTKSGIGLFLPNNENLTEILMITEETTPENNATNIPAAPNLEKSNNAPVSVNSGRINIMNKQSELKPAKIFFLSSFFFSIRNQQKSLEVIT